MTLGLAPKQGDLLHTTVGYCESRIDGLDLRGVDLECFTLFPDEMSADVGRLSVPPLIV